MPLPIPDILENASNVLRAAQKVISAYPLRPGTADSDVNVFRVSPTATEQEFAISELMESLKGVKPDDLLAVLNEVGKVYAGLHNIQILSIGSRANPPQTAIDVAIAIDFGLGPRQLVCALPIESAKSVIKGFNDNLAALQAATGQLITDIALANG